MRLKIEKASLIIISAILALIVFVILTLVQNSLINCEEEINVLIAIKDIEKETKLNNSYFKEVFIPVSLAKELGVLTRLDNELYNRTNIYKGQFVSNSLVATKEELKIIEVEENKEKISLELTDEASMLSYQIKKGDKVNLYFTGKPDVVDNIASKFSNVLSSNLTTIKILENEEILGIYDKDGVGIESENFTVPTSIVFGVTKENAEVINNLRNQGDFNITMGGNL